MGKISDLWVKLGLKKQEFDRGMQDVQKTTKKTEGIFSQMEGAGVKAWEMICEAALKAAKDILVATNKMSDEWELFCAKGKAAWDSFTKNFANNASWKTAITGIVTSINWTDLFRSIGKNGKAAEALFSAKDADTEISNSIKLERARIGEQLEQLRIDMRDATKSYEERANAAKEYERLILPIYDKEIERVQRLKDAQYEAFVANSKWDSNGGVKANQRIWEEMLVAYGDQSKIAALGGKTFFDAIAGGTDNQALLKYAADRFGLGSENVAKYWLDNFYGHYETGRNGEEVQALVDSILAVYAAEAARTGELRTVKTAFNNATAGMEREKEQARAELEAEQQKFEDILQEIQDDFTNSLNDIIYEPIEIEIEPIEIDTTDVDHVLDKFINDYRERMQEIAELNQMLEDSIVQSLSGSLQAFTDMLVGLEGANASGVLAALLTPFADMAVRLGEMIVAEGLAVQAFQDSLLNPVGGGAAPIAAGLALIAIGSAVRSGMQAMARGGAGGAGASYGAESASSWAQDFNTEMTIYVKGRLDGGDLVLSGQKTTNMWAR